jgi:hypothetical protein
MTKAICFYFPYLEDSGVPVLFYRMANHIACSNPSIMVSIIDYEDGAMWRNVLNLPNLFKIRFEDGKEVNTPDDCVLVLQAILPYNWPTELVLKSSQRLFFWNLHPQNLIPSLLPIKYFRDFQFYNFSVYIFLSWFFQKLLFDIRSFVDILISNKALYFMDKSNLDLTAKYLFLNIQNRHFIPVPANLHDPKLIIDETKELGEVINFGWIGRLCDFKSYILVYAIKKLNSEASKFKNKKFYFHIVGTGPFEIYIRNEVKDCNYISVLFHGSLAHNEIDNFILNKIDILMAMGTSALEGAKLGIPTFLLDISLKKIHGDYVFRMLYDTKEFDLGHFISNEDFVNNNTSFYDLVNDIIHNYRFHSKKSFEYFFQNHDIENVSNIFLNKAFNTGLIYSMLNPGYFKKPKFLKFYNKLRGLKS